MGSSAEKLIAVITVLPVLSTQPCPAVAVSAGDLARFTVEHSTSVRADRDAGPYRDIVAMGLRAIHDSWWAANGVAQRVILAQKLPEVGDPMEQQQKEAVKAQKEAQRRQRIAREFETLLAKARVQHAQMRDGTRSTRIN